MPREISILETMSVAEITRVMRELDRMECDLEETG